MNYVIIILCIVGGLWGLSIFLGFVGGMSKSFKNTPSSVSAQSEKTRKQQQETAEETRLKQRQLMEDMKQKISDGRNKY